MDEQREPKALPDEETAAGQELMEKPYVEIQTVQRAMQGDKEAFSALFMQTYRPMYRTVKAYLRRDEDIYDAMQNGYLRAYKYIARLQEPDAFFAWLKKIMQSAAIDILSDLSGQGTAREDIADFADNLAEEYTETAERRADIEEVLSQMDPRHAEVLTLHYYDGMKLSEIARLLNEPQSTVRSRFAKAKKRLTEQLKVKGIDKSLYSGSASTMIAVCLRSLIGTDVLSAATAQRMLDDILAGRHGQLGEAAYKLLEKQRNRAILRAVSLLMALTVGVTCLTFVILNVIPWESFASLPAGPAGQSSTLPGGSGGSGSAGTGITDGRITTADGTTDPSSTKDGTTTEQTSSGTSGSAPTTKPSTSRPSSSGTTTTAAPPAAFVPDYRPGQANTAMRNPIWRAVRRNNGRGYLDWQDEWVYCFTGLQNNYKFRRDGTGGKIPLSSPEGDGIVAPIVYGDWIYFKKDGSTALKRLRTDGAVVETLVEAPAGKNISGFLLQDGRLLYTVDWQDSFGVAHYEQHAYSLATGKDERLAGFGNYSLSDCFLVQDWVIRLPPHGSMSHPTAYSLKSGEAVLFTNLREALDGLQCAVDWDPFIEKCGYLPVSLLGDRLYTVSGHYIDFSADTLRIRQGLAFSKSTVPEGTLVQVEFADEANGRLAVTLYDEDGVYPESMRWYSEKSGWGAELPAALMRNSQYQTYQTSGDGYVFSTTEDGAWFSCRMDGSDYREYPFS